MHWGNTNEIVCKDNSIKTISWNNSLCFDNEDNFEAVLCVGKDITEYKQVENKLQDTIERLKEESEKQKFLFGSLSNLVIETDGKNILNANDRLLEFFGYSNLDEFVEEIGCVGYRFIQHKDYFHLGLLEKDEKWIDVMQKLPRSKQVVVMIDSDYETHAFTVRFSSTTHKRFLIYFDDVTDLMVETKKFEYKAHHDNLTKIFNREKFNDIYKKLAINDEDNSLIMFDIDHFKQVNDTYGHDIGDRVLEELSDRVKEVLKNRVVFSRWGGEEFMILHLSTDSDDAYNVAEKIRTSVESLHIEGVPRVTVSLGVTKIKNSEDKSSALKRVDEALYKAKKEGRNKTVKL